MRRQRAPSNFLTRRKVFPGEGRLSTSWRSTRIIHHTYICSNLDDFTWNLVDFMQRYRSLVARGKCLVRLASHHIFMPLFGGFNIITTSSLVQQLYNGKLALGYIWIWYYIHVLESRVDFRLLSQVFRRLLVKHFRIFLVVGQAAPFSFLGKILHDLLVVLG